MVSYLRAIAICSVSGLCAYASVAVANPFTFDFTTSGWDINQDTAAFGTGLKIAITVDNGSPTAQSQSFDFSDITRVQASAISGSWSIDTNLPGYHILLADAYSVITTDVSTLATLHLGYQGPSVGDWQGGIPGDDTLVLFQSTSAPIQAYLHNGDEAVVAPLPGPNSTIAPLDIPQDVGQQQTVPEPASLALMGLGLAGLGLSRRKSKKQ